MRASTAAHYFLLCRTIPSYTLPETTLSIFPLLSFQIQTSRVAVRARTAQHRRQTDRQRNARPKPRFDLVLTPTIK